MANLALLGIDPEMLALMKAEREHKISYRGGIPVDLRTIRRPPRIYSGYEATREFRHAQKIELLCPPDKQIPITTNPTKNAYPLQTMEVGEWFFVPNCGRNTRQTHNAVTSSVCYIQRKTGRKFSQNRFIQGVRVRRTK